MRRSNTWVCLLVEHAGQRQRGFVDDATTSRHTADSLAFAKAHGTNAQDGTGLLKLIAQRTPEQQARLLEVAYEGEYRKSTCASCGVKMTERESRKDGM